MSDPGELPLTATAVSQSHDVRRKFEKAALFSFVAVIVIFLAAALAGTLWHPVPAGTPDWGGSIVARVISLKDVITDMLLTLLGGVGITFTRGHMDARLDK